MSAPAKIPHSAAKSVMVTFGGVAVLVGAFTIFNTLSITVAQGSRRPGRAGRRSGDWPRSASPGTYRYRALRLMR